MNCLSCGSENRPTAAFCGSCGKALEVVCPACHQHTPVTSSFCDQCGASRPGSSPPSYTPNFLQTHVLVSRSAIEGERKLVTVLFADLAGSTAMAERMDPEAVHAIMQGCIEIWWRSVHRFEGTVNQFTGDGMMALFGAPVAHEEHAVRALRAALAIRQDLRDYELDVQRRWQVPCRMRMGINTGVTVVGPIGDRLRMDYTAVGDTTNLAARLQQMAPPGGIWVSSATQRLAGDHFEWEALPSQPVRGREEPVRVFSLLDLRASTANRFDPAEERRLTPLIGREAELGRFEQAWSLARAGAGQVLSVIAEAGLGKTRLLHEFKRRLAPDERSLLCEGSCFDHGTTSAYLPFREPLKALLQIEGVPADAEGASRVSKAVADLGLDAMVSAVVLSVLSFPAPEEKFGAISAQVVRDALRRVISAVAARRPLVLIIEDLHWIDQATQEVVNGLVEDAKSLSLLLVLVFRREYLRAFAEPGSRLDSSAVDGAALDAEMQRAGLSKPHATWIALAPIGPEQVTQMLSQLLDESVLPAELVRLFHQTADGNPLFIEELVTSLVESRALVRSDSGWSLQVSAETLRVPEKVQNLFAARVDRLDDELKELLRVASVIGRVFSPAVLGRVYQSASVEGLLRDLQALDLVYRLPEGSAYSFKHALCQDAVYGQIRDAQKKRYHYQVAQAIEALSADRLDEHCELLVHHYSISAALPRAVDDDASPPSPRSLVTADIGVYPERIDRTLEYLRQANRKAISVSAMADAKQYYGRARHALSFLPDDRRNRQRKLELVLDQVFVALALFTYRDYRAVLQEHADLAESLRDRRLLGAFHARVGWCQWSLGEFAAGIETLDRAVEHCRAAGNDEDLGFALMTRAWCELDLGLFPKALSTCQESLQALERSFDLQSYVRTRAAATAVNAYMGRFHAAIAEGKRAVEVAERYGDAGLISFAAMIAAWNYAFMGDLPGALEQARFAVTKADSLADKLFASGSLALVESRMGRAESAAEALAGVVQVIRPMRFPACETFGLYYCEALLRCGRLDEAKAQLHECLGVIGPSDARFYVACAERLLAEVAMAEAEPQVAAAARHFESCMATFEQLGAENELALAWAGYGRLRVVLGDRAAAREYLTKALATFERLGARGEPEATRRVLAELG